MTASIFLLHHRLHHHDRWRLTVRYGAKAIEFEKGGKTAVIVPSKEQLVATLDTLIEGVKAGELDEHLAQQAKARGVPKSKRAP